MKTCLFISLLGHSNKVCHGKFWHKNTWLTLIPYDCILNATSFPIRPNPIIAKTFPNNSDPMNYDSKWILILRRWGKRNFNTIFHNDWDNTKSISLFFEVCACTDSSKIVDLRWNGFKRKRMHSSINLKWLKQIAFTYER